MAAATVDIPSICLSSGPMLNGYWKGERAGSGTIKWEARKLLAAGKIDEEEFIKLVVDATTSPGYCNTMGTATTMNSLDRRSWHVTAWLRIHSGNSQRKS